MYLHDKKYIDLTRNQDLVSLVNSNLSIEDTVVFGSFVAARLIETKYLPQAFEKGDLSSIKLRLKTINNAKQNYLGEPFVNLSKMALRKGMPLIHFVAINGHLPVLRWLVTKQDLDVDMVDSKGRTALQCVAPIPSNEPIIKELKRLKSLKEEREKRRNKMIAVFQSHIRGHFAKTLLVTKKLELESNAGRYGPWQSVISQVYLLELALSKLPLSLDSAEVSRIRVAVSSPVYWSSWSELRAQDSMVVTPYMEPEIPELSELNIADSNQDSETLAIVDCAVPVSKNNTLLSITPVDTSAVRYDSEILLTHSILAWMRHNAGNRLVQIFIQRVVQLAQGDRSYCLSKPLKHCPVGLRFTLFETKLDAGQRILWTQSESASSTKPSILIWYVSKHDKVSHYVMQIDQSFRRLNVHSLVSSSSVSHVSVSINELSSSSSSMTTVTRVLDIDEQVLIDPASNNILKTYVTSVSTLKCIHEDRWTPPLRLTNQVTIITILCMCVYALPLFHSLTHSNYIQETAILEKEGSVLLLGRSGTGKTVCLLNRILRDRHRFGASLRQLFVARTKVLFTYFSALWVV
jgi:hypothetical protein